MKAIQGYAQSPGCWKTRGQAKELGPEQCYSAPISDYTSTPLEYNVTYRTNLSAFLNAPYHYCDDMKSDYYGHEPIATHHHGAKTYANRRR